ncbi:MAG: hypothetical protein KAJ10_14425 [Thermodesulfovibrionia bacterium]|nr:hypothetical protein [Thermodesulfovibrionia bacterium]
MSISEMIIALVDNGGRRLGIDRRQFSYTSHIPNRRLDEDRRIETDRRRDVDRRSGVARRIGKVIFKKIIKPGNDLRERKDRRNELERRAAYAAALTL